MERPGSGKHQASTNQLVGQLLASYYTSVALRGFSAVPVNRLTPTFAWAELKATLQVSVHQSALTSAYLTFSALEKVQVLLAR